MSKNEPSLKKDALGWQELWALFHRNHGLTLTESELLEIVQQVRDLYRGERMLEKDDYCAERVLSVLRSHAKTMGVPLVSYDGSPPSKLNWIQCVRRLIDRVAGVRMLEAELEELREDKARLDSERILISFPNESGRGGVLYVLKGDLREAIDKARKDENNEH